jgi:hypothetical protein
VAFAKSVGIEGTDAAALAALRKVPADQVIAGLNLASMGAPAAATYAGGPMIDGQIMVETAEDAYRAGRNARVPLIVGANSLDIGFSFAKNMDEVMAKFGADKDKALAAYDPDKSGDLRSVGYKVAMDAMMVEPARFLAKTFAAQGLPAYLYRFSYVADSLRAQTPGAPHATEIPFVFDTVKAKYGDKLTANDAAAAKAANAYWANFAKTGNPNGAELTTWPVYKAQTDAILDFTNQGPKAGPDAWKARMGQCTEAAAQGPLKGRPGVAGRATGVQRASRGELRYPLALAAACPARPTRTAAPTIDRPSSPAALAGSSIATPPAARSPRRSAKVRGFRLRRRRRACCSAAASRAAPRRRPPRSRQAPSSSHSEDHREHCPGAAPSAMRTPISCVVCCTSCDITP